MKTHVVHWLTVSGTYLFGDKQRDLEEGTLMFHINIHLPDESKVQVTAIIEPQWLDAMLTIMHDGLGVFTQTCSTVEKCQQLFVDTMNELFEKCGVESQLVSAEREEE